MVDASSGEELGFDGDVVVTFASGPRSLVPFGMCFRFRPVGGQALEAKVTAISR